MIIVFKHKHLKYAYCGDIKSNLLKWKDAMHTILWFLKDDKRKYIDSTIMLEPCLFHWNKELKRDVSSFEKILNRVNGEFAKEIIRAHKLNEITTKERSELQALRCRIYSGVLDELVEHFSRW